ncbi:MAG: hypothetical protein HYW86_03335 [Candidatus Roizmanbacteria bacterium]|nr:MAG: hypothetical protein HYW86_03335 [Candidatus Roizmanbacteria bacterium]
MKPELHRGMSQELMVLEPTVGSVPWCKKENDYSQIDRLKYDSSILTGLLSDYKSIPSITTFDAIKFTNLAAKATSEDLFYWIQFHMFYHTPIIDIDQIPKDNEKLRSRYFQATADFYRNIAVWLRDDSNELKAFRSQEDTETQEVRSQFYFTLYLHSQRNFEIASGMSSSDDYECDQSLNVTNSCEADNRTVTEDIEDATEDYMSTVFSLISDKCSIEGIDSGLIRVLSLAPLPKNDEFSFIYQEHDKLIEFIAKRNNVEKEGLKSFLGFE